MKFGKSKSKDKRITIDDYNEEQKDLDLIKHSLAKKLKGNFEKNKPKGEGVWHFTNGNKIKGEFSHMAGENPEGEPIISIRWSTNPEITDPTKFKEVM